MRQKENSFHSLKPHSRDGELRAPLNCGSSEALNYSTADGISSPMRLDSITIVAKSEQGDDIGFVQLDSADMQMLAIHNGHGMYDLKLSESAF